MFLISLCIPIIHPILENWIKLLIATKKSIRIWMDFYLRFETVRTRLELVISCVTGRRPKPTRPTDQTQYR